MMVELPRFRYLDDVLRFLTRIDKDVSELSKVCVQRHTLARKAMANTELGVSAPSKRTLQAVQRLDDVYNAVHSLNDYRRSVDACETTVNLSFPNQRKRALGTCNELRSRIDTLQQQVLTDLNEVSKCPQFSQYLEKIKAQLSTVLSCADMQTYSYVHADKQSLCYVYYLVLIDVDNQQQGRAPLLYISMRWTPGQSFIIDVHHEFEVPTRLVTSNTGTSCKPADAFRTIQSLLIKEHFQ